MPWQITDRKSEATGKPAWQVRVQVGVKEDGKPRYATKTFRLKREAEEYRAKLIRDRSGDSIVLPAKITVNEFLDRYLEERPRQVGPRGRRMRPNTVTSYAAQLANHVRPAIGERRLDRLGRSALNRMVAEMADNVGARSVEYTIAILRAAFNWGVEERILPRNPMNGVKSVAPRDDEGERSEMRALTKEEAIRFQDAAKTDRLGALFMLALRYGLRPSEYLGLKWDDIDFKARSISIQRTLAWGKEGKWWFGDTKTKSSRRLIIIDPEMAEVLEAHRVAQLEERMKAGPAWQDNGLVFTTLQGAPLERHNLIKKNFLRVLRKAKLVEVIDPAPQRKGKHGPQPQPKVKALIRLYDLRHTCASLLLEGGANPKVVAELLGHKSITITLDIYSHLLPSMKQDAATRMAELFG